MEKHEALAEYAKAFQRWPDLCPEGLKFGRFTLPARRESDLPCDDAGWYTGHHKDATKVPDDHALALCRSGAVEWLGKNSVLIITHAVDGWWVGRENFDGAANGPTLDHALINALAAVRGEGS